MPSLVNQANKRRLVIVGAGMAGSKLANDLWQTYGHFFQIVLIGEEPNVGYNRIMLSSLLANDISPADMPLVDTQKMQDDGVQIHSNDPVTSLDLETKRIRLSSGQTITYDQLVLATGSRASVLPIKGASAPNAMGFRTWNDVEAMTQLKGCQSICVVGGGLLGLEAAVGLAKRGHKVVVFHRSNWLLNRQLDEESAGLLLNRLEQMGIEFRLGESPASFLQTDDGKVSHVVCQNGEPLAVNLVVMAAGISPEIALAKSAGLETNRAILVDEQMQTSHADVYALGECCEFDQQTFGLVAPIWAQINVLMKTLAGEEAAFVIEPTPTKLKVSGVNLFSVGKIHTSEDDSSIFFKDVGANHYRKLVVNDGLLVGAILYGNVADGSWYFQLIQNKTNVSDILDLLIFGEAYCCPQVA
ncbi:NAD(P)/FAD-dependent oxidoreductase [Marinomonas rhizomae]|uniref:Assimilatory nitrate reductase (NADH) beta subunit n=1 Tax=Marinomonas rhizomae TaxID=491948 RepID=A0A366JD30_9GAMM|nr:FAD-dependent oxidoreductase [Marinomonas rhizomae]RBP84195.1 assimilatory nitrate reductase (NADH) beta subunit [Marinomonas rhizomae]RNF74525.1 NAD(P)/FAD-dependent oxidoreductase [Marinomonas rhizomae]